MRYTLSDFRPGDRIELSPATDAWMKGDRYGEVLKVGTIRLRVKADKSGKLLKVSPELVYDLLPRGQYGKS